MNQVVARSNGRFLFYFLIMIPITFGVGSIILWIWRRSFVYKVDGNGILLRSGREIPWADVQSLLARKGAGENAGTVSRVDITYAGGRALVLSRWLENGDEVAEALRVGLREFRQAGARMRSRYVQRRK